MILLVDNYDSFTYNLAHLFGALGAEVVVKRNDEVDADEAERLAPSQLVVSPGPGRPRDAGATSAILERLIPTTPTLGVCLGHQALVEVCGGEVGYARELLHGKASPVRHDGEVMAVRHRELRVFGVQFHPESVLTPQGAELARNFIGGGAR